MLTSVTPRKRDIVPGPGTYNPVPVETHIVYSIRPLPPVPQPPDQQDKEALVKFEKKQMFMASLSESKHRHPEPGAYTLPSSFSDSPRRTPRGPQPDMKLFGTPRSERVLFNVDLFDVSKCPGPGQYDLRSTGIAGRDRLYRKKLPLETINFLAPRLPPIASPRRKEE